MLRLVLAAALVLPLSARAEDVTVFAAASLKTALDEIATDWQQTSGDTVTVSYAGSSQLARQIQQGAPADLFISAAVDWMDTVESDGLIAKGSRVDLLGNTLVIVGAADAPDLDIATLSTALGGGKLAMALVDSVPAGVYGKQALTSLGLWDGVSPSVAQADNVRAALALVATGEAPYGIVYASDAVAEPAVKVVATFPDDSHDPIVYPAAALVDAGPAATGFLDHLSSEAAATTFREQGFEVLGQ
ncbi:molybdate ABC transporter substrate-binding protein [Cereibacter sp. SYSU M97828]|nr:molybdate ABC transporter substrate-binding protein [Cereibacter flavus]